ncbi:hypothetical protein [Natronomonas amylolytica]|uniref:hypothetical protein n=1 Tax=Natronomonas amylolytica TaxID=3108498 RepID=UPI00300A9946
MGYKKRVKSTRKSLKRYTTPTSTARNDRGTALVGKPLGGEILREIQEEFESYSEYDPDSVRHAEQYFRYEGYPYTITVVMAE